MKKTSLLISTLPRCHTIDPNGNPNRPLMPCSRLSESLPVSLTITHSPHKPLNNACCGLLKAHRPALHRLVSLTALIASTLALSTLLTPMAYAALSATTANTIQGTHPYFTLDGVKMATTDELLGFIYPDAGVPGGKVKVDASKTGTIITVPAGTKEDEIKPLIMANAAGTAQTLLGALSGTPGVGLEVGDDDGDVSGGTSATGGLIVTFKKNGTNIAPGSVALSGCNSYQLTVTTSGTIKATTTYGAPNDHTYSGATSATYTIIPSVTTPYSCFAQPNLKFGDNNNATGNGMLGYNFAGSNTQWNPTKGFIPQIETGVGPTNFPTTGFNKAYFLLTVGGTTAGKVVTDTGASNSSGGITMKLDDNGAATGNIVKVTLEGPSNTTPPTGAFGGATFQLKSGATNIYRFTLSKWFIAKQGGHAYNGTAYAGPPAGQTVPQYCASLPGFKVPSVLDYTNAFTAAQIGLGGSTAGSYTRAINGGIFAEWGYTYNTYYTNSDWETNFYGASEPWSATNQYVVASYNGYAGYGSPSDTGRRAACVSP